MKEAAKHFILIDTFTAYYGACVSKDGVKISKNMDDGAYDLPLILCPVMQSNKKDYTLDNFITRKNTKLSILSLPTIPAIENYFDLLDLKYQMISWEKYIINDFSWKNFIDYPLLMYYLLGV